MTGKLTQSEEGTQGIGNKNLVLKTIRSFCVPLPPIAEQKRIIDVVSSLMIICDSLASLLAVKSNTANALVKASVAVLTGVSTEEVEELKIPKTELVSKLRLGESPTIKEQAPLAAILAQQNGEMVAKDLWQRFGLEIDDFYAQLKIEVSNGWILEPAVAEMQVVKAE